MFAILHISTWWLIVRIGGGRVSVWLSRLNLKDVQMLNHIVTTISLCFSKNSTQQLSHKKNGIMTSAAHIHVDIWLAVKKAFSPENLVIASMQLQMCPSPPVQSHQYEGNTRKPKMRYISQKHTGPRHTAIEYLVYCWEPSQVHRKWKGKARMCFPEDEPKDKSWHKPHKSLIAWQTMNTSNILCPSRDASNPTEKLTSPVWPRRSWHFNVPESNLRNPNHLYGQGQLCLESNAWAIAHSRELIPTFPPCITHFRT